MVVVVVSRQVVIQHKIHQGAVVQQFKEPPLTL